LILKLLFIRIPNELKQKMNQNKTCKKLKAMFVFLIVLGLFIQLISLSVAEEISESDLNNFSADLINYPDDILDIDYDLGEKIIYFTIESNSGKINIGDLFIFNKDYTLPDYSEDLELKYLVEFYDFYGTLLSSEETSEIYVGVMNPATEKIVIKKDQIIVYEHSFDVNIQKLNSISNNLEKYIFIESVLTDDDVKFNKAYVIEDNSFYSGLFLKHSGPLDYEKVYLVLSSSDNPSVFELEYDYLAFQYDVEDIQTLDPELKPDDSFLPLLNSEKKKKLIKIEMDAKDDYELLLFNSLTKLLQIYQPNLWGFDELMYQRSIDFCDGDGICEPCFSDDCLVSETFASCGDCSSGSLDNYCDLRSDGVCDPDCEGYDLDCGFCEKDRGCLLSSKSFEEISCDTIGGFNCLTDMSCYDGLVVDTLDSGICCVGGFCQADYYGALYDFESEPEFDIEYDEKGVVQIFKPTIVDLDNSQLANSLSPLPFEQNINLLSAEAAEQKIMEDFSTIDFEISKTGEAVPKEIVELEESEKEFEKSMQQDFEQTSQEINSPLKPYSFLFIFILIIVVILIVFAFIVSFVRNSKKQIPLTKEYNSKQFAQPTTQVNQRSTQQFAQPTNKLSAQNQPAYYDLQKIITDMVKRRYNYSQIKQILIKKGYLSSNVDSEIRKHYSNFTQKYGVRK
jgi:flagellar basal body-associated protein FliL